MTTETLTLSAWLLERIAEDEAVALDAIGTAAFQKQTGSWRLDAVPDQFGETLIVFALADNGGKTQAADVTAAWEGRERGEHIARNDPARVLATCKAHRAIVGLHDEAAKSRAALDYLHGDPDMDAVMGPLRDTLRALASVYADAPGYREEWAL